MSAVGAPTAGAKKERRARDLRSLLNLLGPFRGLMGLTIGAGVLNQGLAIAGAAVGAYLVGAAVTGGSVSGMAPWLAVLGALVLGRAAAAWAEMWLAHEMSYRLLADIRGSLYWSLERLAPGYLLERRSGDVAGTAMSDVETLEWFFAHTVGAFVVAVLVPLGAVGALFFIHPLLPLVLLPFVALVTTVPLWLGGRAGRQGRELRGRLGEVNAEVVEAVQGLREVVAFGSGPKLLAKLGRHNSGLVSAQIAHGKRSGIEGATTDAFVSAGVVGVLAASAYLVSRGEIPYPMFPVAIILAAYTFAPIVAVTGTARNFGLIFAAAERVFALLQKPAPVVDETDHPPAGPIEPRVRFEGVGFGYGPGLPNALQGVSFEVAPGETVALVGHSGAGKSTCASLLQRFWDVGDGRVTIGGHDIRAFPQEALRGLISAVPQDIYLFNEPIRENIRLGKPDATDAEVERAARTALAHGFIEDLPAGYGTNAGERGLQLSGGQRQRIGIARALLKDASILVMDEAVSNLDAENERELRAAMRRLEERRTTLAIAHRLSTIRAADRIVVLEKGRVAETGTHDELLAREGAYARLIASQNGGRPASQTARSKGEDR